MPEYIVLSRRDPDSPWEIEAPIFPDHDAAKVWYDRNVEWFAAHHLPVEFRIRRLIDPVEQEARREVYAKTIGDLAIALADAGIILTHEQSEVLDRTFDLLHDLNADQRATT